MNIAKIHSVHHAAQGSTSVAPQEATSGTVPDPGPDDGTERDQTPRGAVDRLLSFIERVGNKLPEPFTLFLLLFLATAVISTVMAWAGLQVQVPGDDEVRPIKGFFTSEGLAWFTVNLGKNYVGFPPLVYVLPIILAVGIAERSGMLSALIRRLFSSANTSVLPYAVGLIGVSGSLIADPAFIVIPPLAAMVFQAAGRHPVAGLLGGFASVGAGYATSLLPGSLDALFAGITNSVMEALPSLDAPEVTVVSNYWFNLVSAIVLGLLAGFIIDKVLEPRLNKLGVPNKMVAGDDGMTRDRDGKEISAELTDAESRGLRATLWATLLLTVVCTIVVLIPNSPWRNEEGNFLPDSPLMQSTVFIVVLYFVVMGLVFGMVAGTIKRVPDVADMMAGAMKDMVNFLILAFILGQFIALFNWSGIGTFTAVKGANALESAGITGFAAIFAFAVLASCLNLLIISGSALWTLMAAVFVPMFALIGFDPAFIQAAFRVGDSATQIITPLNPYIIVILTQLRRYEPKAGVGTLMSRLIMFTVPFWIFWMAMLFIWYTFDLPLGPGAAIFL